MACPLMMITWHKTAPGGGITRRLSHPAPEPAHASCKTGACLQAINAGQNEPNNVELILVFMARTVWQGIHNCRILRLFPQIKLYHTIRSLSLKAAKCNISPTWNQPSNGHLTFHTMMFLFDKIPSQICTIFHNLTVNVRDWVCNLTCYVWSAGWRFIPRICFFFIKSTLCLYLHEIVHVYLLSVLFSNSFLFFNKQMDQSHIFLPRAVFTHWSQPFFKWW